MIDWLKILCGVLGMGLSHWLGERLAKSWPCRKFFVIRILVGVPVFLYCMFLVYSGFLGR